LKIRTSYFLAFALLIFGCVPMVVPFAYSPPASKHQAARRPVVPPSPAAPELKRLKNDHYYVRKPWTVEVNDRIWVVPRGYSSNGITAPAALKNSLGDGVQYQETWAAVFHDWLFTQPGITRAQADQTFYDLLLAYGVPAQKARLMFTTVSAYSLSKELR
jgi:hypothetical protein